jgi:hypothetical protein
MSGGMKRLAILTAAVALALTPAAAAAKKPEKAHDRGAKVERRAAKPGSARERCSDERRTLGPAEFAAKYGKPRTKGSAKARAKAARAAFGRCVSQTARRLRAEREAAEDEAADVDDDGSGDLDDDDLEQDIDEDESADAPVVPAGDRDDDDADEDDHAVGKGRGHDDDADADDDAGDDPDDDAGLDDSDDDE